VTTYQYQVGGQPVRIGEVHVRLTPEQARRRKRFIEAVNDGWHKLIEPVWFFAGEVFETDRPVPLSAFGLVTLLEPTLEKSAIELLRNPETQSKLMNVLNRVIGKKPPTPPDATLEPPPASPSDEKSTDPPAPDRDFMTVKEIADRLELPLNDATALLSEYHFTGVAWNAKVPMELAQQVIEEYESAEEEGKEGKEGGASNDDIDPDGSEGQSGQEGGETGESENPPGQE
jgi:hypothetical protein